MLIAEGKARHRAIRQRALAKVSKIDIAPIDDGTDWAAERAKCAADFWYFADKFARVYDEEIGDEIPFVPYPAQRRIIDDCLAGTSQIIGKSRRLGVTTCCLLWGGWRCWFNDGDVGVVFTQDLLTARKIIRLFNRLERMLPAGLVPKRDKSNMSEVHWANGSELTIYAATERSARAIGADWALGDEGAFTAYLREAVAAVEPSLGKRRGVFLLPSTSDGPGTAWAEFWHRAKRGVGLFKPVFLSWRDRPGQDDAWYARIMRQYEGRDVERMHEHPDSESEMFAGKAGRVFPSFSRDRHVFHKDRPENARLYRSLDIGFSPQSATVCLWAWHNPDGQPSLTFEPECETLKIAPGVVGSYADGIDQMIAYGRDHDTGKILDADNDLPDALRYLVTTCGITGELHVYRILFVRFDQYSTESMVHIADWIRELSGWVKTPFNGRWVQSESGAETYTRSIGDKARAADLRFLRGMAGEYGPRLDFQGYEPIEGTRTQIEPGCDWINALLTNSQPYRSVSQASATEVERQACLAGRSVEPKRTAGAVWRDQVRERRSGVPRMASRSLNGVTRL